MSDAITYIQTRPGIGGRRRALWGLGHEAGVAIYAGAYDKRVKAVISIRPFFSGEVDSLRFPPGILDAAFKERAELIKTPKKEPIYVPIFTESKNAAIQNPQASVIGSPQGYMLWSTFKL